jgi:ankyrin repeat protein
MQRKAAAGSNKATNPPSPLPSLCGHCQQPAQPGKRLLVCSSCYEAYYCSTEHQVADWNCHKILCKQRKKEKEKEKGLWNACIRGEVERARQILLKGVDVNQICDGCTPAYVACQNGHTECLSLLINHGAELDKADDEGATPAFVACQNGHTECLSLLIDHGAQLDKADNTGFTPAYSACENGRTECLSLLINHGAQLDKADDEGATPAYIACEYGHTSCLSLLIDHGAQLDKAQNQGVTPAYIACQNGHTSCLSLLINHGAQLDKAQNQGVTPAYIACENDHTECLSLLVNHGVDCSKTTDCGRGPIHIACDKGYFECVEALLDRGKVDVNCTSIHRETSAFRCCIMGHVKILHLLIQHGADLSLANTLGRSPAHVASAHGRVKMLALINKVNADLINQRDNQGGTPLLFARQFGHDDAAEWLIEHGAEEAGEALEGAELERVKV